MKDILSAVEERLDDQSARGLATAVSRAVRDGAISGGAALPPIRTVAHELALSPTTVSSAWRILQRAGVIRTDGRRGSRIAEAGQPHQDRYARVVEEQTDLPTDLSTGVPDPALLPSLTASLDQLTTARVPRSYLDDPVLPGLRDAVLADWPYAASRLAVTDGALDALELVGRTALRYGDRVVVEDPCFPPLVDLLASLGAEVVGVPMDDEGMLLEPLAERVDDGARAVMLQPRAQNPTGICLSRKRARAIARLLAGRDVLVIEDDSMGAISSAPELSLGEWLPEQTVHIRSFAKSHGPDLRIAAMTGPAELMGECAARRQLAQGWTSRLLQRVLLDLLTRAEAQDAVSRAREVYASRRTGLVDALAARGIPVPGTDGLNIWVEVADESAALVRLAGQGVAAAPGSPFAVSPGPAPHIRVTAGHADGDLEALAELIAQAARARSRTARHR
ncbi:aminotransferase class I/II-fold pyridoxal phosphate-dependent enzyme [Actinomycetota bacterium]